MSLVYSTTFPSNIPPAFTTQSGVAWDSPGEVLPTSSTVDGFALLPGTLVANDVMTAICYGGTNVQNGAANGWGSIVRASYTGSLLGGYLGLDTAYSMGYVSIYKVVAGSLLEMADFGTVGNPYQLTTAVTNSGAHAVITVSDDAGNIVSYTDISSVITQQGSGFYLEADDATGYGDGDASYFELDGTPATSSFLAAWAMGANKMLGGGFITP
jgi:hypothetical protein